MKNNNLKNKIKSGQLTVGSWITIGDMTIGDILANAGFDWLVIDLEHSVISISQAAELIRIIEQANTPPLVRLTSNNEHQIKRVLDAGAHGIIVPMINTALEAEKAVKSCRYEPLGTRGVGLGRAHQYGASFQEYLAWQSDMEQGPIVIVQIEHIDALDNLKQILNVPGVDAFIIGPYDLSCSMGIPGQFDNPEFKKTINQILDIGNEVGAKSGFHVVEPNLNELNSAISSGYKFIAYSVDIRMLDTSARTAINSIK